MRKSTLCVSVFITLFAVGAAWGRPIQLQGTHSEMQVFDACAASGSTMENKPNGHYGCSTNCHGGEGKSCSVDCNKDGKCTGDCPSCGKRIIVRPRLKELLRSQG